MIPANIGLRDQTIKATQTKQRHYLQFWTTYPEIGKYGKKYAIAVTELSEVAGNGLEALNAKMGALGKSCKGCHDEFQDEHSH
ncbi:MAG: cytochrome c [Pseudomonadales bacterium]|nr:cytochrome c [Pseudomonadales bacterium]